MSVTLRTRRTLQISLLAVGLCKPLWASVNSPPAPRWNPQSIALASAGNVPSAPVDGANPLATRAIKRAAMQQVEAKLNREKGVLRQELLAADAKEIAALRTAVAAAMKGGNVSAVLAEHHLLKTEQIQCQGDRTAPPFFGVSLASEAAPAGLSKPLRSVIAARTRVARSAAKAWATAWAQAQVAYPQLVIEALQRQIVEIKAALKADMASGNVHAVIRGAKALKLAKAEIAMQKRAIRNAKAQLAIANAPRSRFISCGGPATGIVYILDHEGSMLENFSFLQTHLRRSIDGLVPSQSFAVLVFRKNYKILGPNRLIHATLHNKQEFFKRFSTVAPAGAAEYRYRYFSRPFQAAFRLKPQIIYFLTSGAFDPKLISFIKKLNKTKAVHIYTYAFVLPDPTSIKNLKAIARQNGGEYKYISRKAAGE